jgi:hypothetical protein
LFEKGENRRKKKGTHTTEKIGCTDNNGAWKKCPSNSVGV